MKTVLHKMVIVVNTKNNHISTSLLWYIQFDVWVLEMRDKYDCFSQTTKRTLVCHISRQGSNYLVLLNYSIINRKSLTYSLSIRICSCGLFFANYKLIRIH